jgi:hypothetical protein
VAQAIPRGWIEKKSLRRDVMHAECRQPLTAVVCTPQVAVSKAFECGRELWPPRRELAALSKTVNIALGSMLRRRHTSGRQL